MKKERMREADGQNETEGKKIKKCVVLVSWANLEQSKRKWERGKESERRTKREMKMKYHKDREWFSDRENYDKREKGRG